MFTVVAAIDKNGGFGNNGSLPWKFPNELKWFKDITRGSVVIMGKKTWESLPDKMKPLPNRTNIVVTTDNTYSLPPTVWKASSIEDTINLMNKRSIKQGFVIGGAYLIRSVMEHDALSRLYITLIDGEFDTDTVSTELLEMVNNPFTHKKIRREELMKNLNDMHMYNVTQYEITKK